MQVRKILIVLLVCIAVVSSSIAEKNTGMFMTNDQTDLITEGFILYDETKAIGDTEEPYIDIESIVSSRSKATVGQKVTISICISDNVGIARAVISLNNQESGKSYYYESLTYNPQKDKWQYVFEVNENTPNGTYTVSGLQAYDDAGNVCVVSPYKEVFTVYGAADSEKPQINADSIKSSKSSITIGESTTISLVITDNIEVSRAVISVSNQESGKTLHYEPLTYNSKTGRWQYRFTVEEDTPDGSWVVSGIQAYDAVGNVDVVLPYIEVFNVYGAADSERPVIDLDSLTASKTSATLCDDIIVSLKITDNTAIERANISFHNNDVNNSLHYQPLTYNAKKDRWEYTFNVTDKTPDGVWSVSSIQAYDTVGNVSVVFPYINLFTINHLFDFSNAKCIVIPDSTRTIGEEAFSGCGIGNVIISKKCKSIKSRAFANNKTLRIFIPSSVTSIASDAFDGCKNVVIYSDEYCYAQEYADGHNIYFVLNK